MNFESFIDKLNKDGFLDNSSAKEIKDDIHLLLEKKILEKAVNFSRLHRELFDKGIKVSDEDLDTLGLKIFQKFL